jgi:tellurium resistance protein TerD
MISLEKKSPISLTKKAPGLTRVRVGLSWDPTADGRSADADASVFMLNANGKLPSDGYFVFFNNLSSPDGAVVHAGDNRTGAGDGDDETIDIDLSRISTDVLQIMLCITIHNIGEGFHFGNVLNASARVYNMGNNTGICEYKLTESYANCDAMILGRFYRNGTDWEFEGMGQAFGGGLQAAVDLYQ